MGGGNIGIMENKMETTIVCWGYNGVILWTSHNFLERSNSPGLRWQDSQSIAGPS